MFGQNAAHRTTGSWLSETPSRCGWPACDSVRSAEGYLRHPQPPLLGAALQVADVKALLVAIVDLGEQGQRLVRRDQFDGRAGSQGVEGAEDGCVSDRVRDAARVQYRVAGVRFAALAVAIAGRGDGKFSGHGFNLLH